MEGATSGHFRSGKERKRCRKRGRVVIRRVAALRLYTAGQRGVDWKEREREREREKEQVIKSKSWPRSPEASRHSGVGMRLLWKRCNYRQLEPALTFRIGILSATIECRSTRSSEFALDSGFRSNGAGDFEADQLVSTCLSRNSAWIIE